MIDLRQRRDASLLYTETSKLQVRGLSSLQGYVLYTLVLAIVIHNPTSWQHSTKMTTALGLGGYSSSDDETETTSQNIGKVGCFFVTNIEDVDRC